MDSLDVVPGPRITRAGRFRRLAPDAPERRRSAQAQVARFKSIRDAVPSNFFNAATTSLR